MSYHNICAMAAGSNPSPSPADKSFHPYHIPRIICGNMRYGSNYWLDDLDQHPGERYISDGDPLTVTVTESESARIDKQRLVAEGLHLRTYTLPKPTKSKDV